MVFIFKLWELHLSLYTTFCKASSFPPSTFCLLRIYSNGIRYFCSQIREAMFKKPFQKNPFFIKLLNREYWPMWANYLPVYPYYLFLAAKARSFFFFTATNPSIETGGMLGESKIAILDMIADEYKPKSLLIEKGTPIAVTKAILEREQISYPIIVKPDVGERGLLVTKVDNETQLETVLKANDIHLIIQPFVDYNEEFAIMYYRYPNQKRGTITSICQKKFLSVTGDGKSSLETLIWKQSRAILQWEVLKIKYANRLEEVLPDGETLQLIPIGNHAKGTMFLNGNHLIDEQLEQVFDKIVDGMTDVYFGRFDLKCRSVEDLKAGQHIRIVEFNGVGAEPAHIYDPNYSLWNTYKDLLNQWTLMYKIGTSVHKNLGVPYMSIKEMKTYWKDLKSYKEGLK